MSVQALSCAFAVRGLSSSEKLVLLALANYAGPTMSCFPSQDRIAEDTELSSRTVWAALKSMEERGIVTRQSRKRNDGTRATDVFTLHFGQADPVANPAKSTRKFCEDQSQSLHEPVATIATLTTFEPATKEPVVDVDDGRERVINWNERLDEAREVAGDGINPTSPALFVYRDLKTLCEGNPPCEWDEVLDAIRVTGAACKARGETIRSWTWVHRHAYGFRDRRLAGIPAPRIVAQSTGPPSFTDKIAVEHRQALDALLALPEAENGR